jgi:hypothetical protein
MKDRACNDGGRTRTPHAPVIEHYPRLRYVPQVEHQLKGPQTGGQGALVQVQRPALLLAGQDLEAAALQPGERVQRGKGTRQVDECGADVQRLNMDKGRVAKVHMADLFTPEVHLEGRSGRRGR